MIELRPDGQAIVIRPVSDETLVLPTDLVVQEEE